MTDADVRGRAPQITEAEIDAAMMHSSSAPIFETPPEHNPPAVRTPDPEPAPDADSKPKDASKPKAAPAPSGDGPIVRMRQLLESRRDSIAAVLARGNMTTEQLVAMACSAAIRAPKIASCNPPTIVASVMTSARLGLDCSGGPLAEAYLVPFGGDCTLMVSYRGLCKLVRQSGVVSNIWAFVVYDGDKISVELGSSPRVVHVPNYEVERTDDRITHVYSCAEMRDGTKMAPEVMTIDQVEDVRALSKYPNGDPWRLHKPEMTRKTVVRRHTKYLPMSTDVQRAIAELDSYEFDFSNDGAPKTSRAEQVLGSIRKNANPVGGVRHDEAGS